MLVVWLLLAVLLFPVVWLAVIASIRRRIRRRRVWSGDDHTSVRPDALSPAVAGALIDAGQVREQHLLATVIDLVDRGVIHTDGLDIDAPIVGVGGTDEVAPHERTTAKMVDSLAAGGTVRLADLAQALETSPIAIELWKSFQRNVRTELKRSGLVTRKLLVFTIIATYVGLQIAFALDVVGEPDPRNDIVELTVIGLNVAAAGYLFAGGLLRGFWTSEGAVRAAGWVAYRRYIEDSTRLSDATYIERHLYGDLQADAVALGVAAATIDQFNLEAPQRAVFDMKGHVADMISAIDVPRSGQRQPGFDWEAPAVLIFPSGHHHTGSSDAGNGEPTSHPDLGSPTDSGPESVAVSHGPPERAADGQLLGADELRAIGRIQAREHLQAVGFSPRDCERLLSHVFG